MGIKMKTSLTRTFYKFLVCLLGGLCLSVVVPFACMMFASSIGLVTLADNNERQTKALVPILTATPNVSDIHFPTGTKFLRLTKNYGYIGTQINMGAIAESLFNKRRNLYAKLTKNTCRSTNSKPPQSNLLIPGR